VDKDASTRPLRRARNTAQLAAMAAIDATVPRWPPALLDRVHRARVKAIAHHAYATVPFYRDAMDAAGLSPAAFETGDDFARLPLIDGDFVQDNLDRFLSRAYGRDARKGFHTSGSSTGRRRLVFWDDPSLLRKAARLQRDRRVLNRLAGERSLATMMREFAGEQDTAWQRALGRVVGDRADFRRLSIMPVDYSSRTQRTFWSQWTFIPARAGHYELLSPNEPYPAVADTLDELRPRVVFSYGSYAEEFFRYLHDSGRRVALPRLWVYMGDIVGSHGRELACELGCRLYSVYGSMEAGTIGFQCERCQGFHLNTDICAVRIADDDGRTLAPGETGDIVVSNLENHSMVLLNYRQGDRGTLAAHSCPCGRTLPLLEQLDGRRSDVIETADGRRLSALNVEGLFRAELRHARQCQLHQAAPGKVSWRVVPGTGTDHGALRTAILSRGREVLGERTELQVEFTDRITKTARGKMLRVTR
jgi:phenylacetate-CoA ligase